MLFWRDGSRKEFGNREEGAAGTNTSATEILGSELLRKSRSRNDGNPNYYSVICVKVVPPTLGVFLAWGKQPWKG
jgi:hypothetical protein